MELRMDAVYAVSDDVVAREIEGELIIVPIVAGIGDAEDALFSLNESGRAIWDRLDGQTSLCQVVEALAGEYEAPAAVIERDVRGFVAELMKRRIVAEVSAG